MSIGNMVLGGSCVWGTNCLQVPSGSGLVSTGAPVPAANGCFTAEIAVKINSWSDRDVIFGQCGKGHNMYTEATDRFSVYSYSSAIRIAVRKSTGTSSSTCVVITPGIALTKGEIYVLDIVVGTDKVSIYNKGQLVSEAAYTYTAFDSDIRLVVSALDAEGTLSYEANSLDVYCINYYDRALSAEEIERNFQTINERFELGL